jgi:hypothetical protein
MTQPAIRPFGMTSCRDMLNKLEREITRFASSAERDEIVDHALNAAMTAWHLAEWTWPDTAHSAGLRERIAEEMHENIPTRDPFTLLRRYAVKHCPDLRLCELIANTAKHLECRSLNAESKFSATVAPAELMFANDLGQPTVFVNDKGLPITWTNDAWELCVTNEVGQKRRAADVFGTVHHWWTQFIYGNKVDEEQESLPEDLR